MQGDIDNLIRLLEPLLADNHDAGRLAEALIALIAAFPVYRTYIENHDVSTADRAYLRTAVDAAAQYEPQLAETLKSIEAVFLTQADARTTTFITRFQQITDTAVVQKALV